MIRSQETNDEIKIISESQKEMLLPTPEILNKGKLSLIRMLVSQHNITESNV